jgi:hypothetical protein
LVIRRRVYSRKYIDDVRRGHISGILLPKMKGVFGRADWFANGTLFCPLSLGKALGLAKLYFVCIAGIGPASSIVPQHLVFDDRAF